MQLPRILQGESLTRLIQGSGAGFLATVVIGFGWGGWTLGNTATKMADQSAKNAVVSVLAPICVDNFQHATAAKATLAELKTIELVETRHVHREGRLGDVSWHGSAKYQRCRSLCPDAQRLEIADKRNRQRCSLRRASPFEKEEDHAGFVQCCRDIRSIVFWKLRTGSQNGHAPIH